MEGRLRNISATARLKFNRAVKGETSNCAAFMCCVSVSCATCDLYVSIRVTAESMRCAEAN